MTQPEVSHAAGPVAVQCVPPPDWVEHRPYSSPTQESGDDFIAGGVCRLLQDFQVNLTQPGYACHYRTAQHVLTRAGAEQAAHLVAEFDPSCERLEVHFVRILRGPECIEHAKPGAFQTFRRETKLERLALNGRLTTTLLIPDVRVDDIVEVALTLYANSPVLGGRYAGLVTFNSFHPCFESRHRIVRPLGRALFSRPFNAPPERQTTVRDGVEQSQWSIVGQKRQEVEELAPPWIIAVPALQHSEFETWSEIARLFEPFYESADIPIALAAEIDQLAQAHSNPADRAAEWLRLVQQKLRYFALALGEGGLVPRDLDAVWAGRFGDCKDAARLYVAGARRLGLDACAALVSTVIWIGAQRFPSQRRRVQPLHRPHAPERNDLLAGSDPAPAIGRSGAYFPTARRVGLALRPETTQLERLDSGAPLHFLNCEDDFHLGPERKSPAKLRRRIDHLFWAADAVRNRIDNDGASKYSEQMLKQLQIVWPGITETEPMVLQDDPVKNRLSVVFTCEIPDCWKPLGNSERLGLKLTDDVMCRELEALKKTQRQADIFLGRPRKLTWRVRVHPARTWHGKGWDRLLQERGLRFTNELKIGRRVIDHTKELVVDAWSVPAAHASGYGWVAGKVRENVVTLFARERFGRIAPPGISMAQLYFWMLFAWCCFIVIVSLLACTSH